MEQETRVGLLAIKAEICRDTLKVNSLLKECDDYTQIEKLYNLSENMRVVVKNIDGILYSTMR